MKHLERSDILDAETYESQRADIRRAVKDIKDPRRVMVGPHFTFLFENFETARHQVQETLRADNKTSEEEIEREITIQNERLGGEGDLSCTLLIQVDGQEEREVKLREWLDLPQHIFLVVGVGSHLQARFDPGQVTEGRLSSIQFVTFACGIKQPVALACTRPGMEQRIPMSDETKAALALDLGIPAPEADQA